jgi:hypothetical protein
MERRQRGLGGVSTGRRCYDVAKRKIRKETSEYGFIGDENLCLVPCANSPIGRDERHRRVRRIFRSVHNPVTAPPLEFHTSAAFGLSVRQTIAVEL